MFGSRSSFDGLNIELWKEKKKRTVSVVVELSDENLQ